MKIKISELLKKDIDIDVCDNICEDLYIAFVGPLKLTKEGEERFKDILDVEVEMFEDLAVVQLDEENWEQPLDDACTLFNSAAGYCASSTYDKWFEG